MENSMAVSSVPEVNIMASVTPTVPDVSLDPMDFQKEINKIAAERGEKIVDGNVVPVDGPIPQTQATQPVAQPDLQVQAAIQQVQPTEVPDKFKTKEGNIDEAKVQKSTMHAQQALKEYDELEKQLRHKQAEVNRLRNEPQQPVNQPQPNYQQGYPQPGYNPNGPLTPEYINRALETSKDPGRVMLELSQLTFNAAKEEAIRAANAEIEQLRFRVESQQRNVELQKIADRDPWVFSQEGIQTLGQIRNDKPWLNAAPEPWLEAYKDYIANRTLNGSSPQVKTPNPMPTTVTSPATPVSGGMRSQPQQLNVGNLSSDRQLLNATLDKMSPEQQTAFWRAVLPGAK